MKKIKVLVPLKVRFNKDTPLREFMPGEYEISDAEYNNWFIKGCIKEGRILNVFDDVEAEPEAEAGAEASVGTEAEATPETVAEIEVGAEAEIDAKATPEALPKAKTKPKASKK